MRSWMPWDSDAALGPREALSLPAGAYRYRSLLAGTPVPMGSCCNPSR